MLTVILPVWNTVEAIILRKKQKKILNIITFFLGNIYIYKY